MVGAKLSMNTFRKLLVAAPNLSDLQFDRQHQASVLLIYRTLNTLIRSGHYFAIAQCARFYETGHSTIIAKNLPRAVELYRRIGMHARAALLMADINDSFLTQPGSKGIFCFPVNVKRPAADVSDSSPK